MADQGQVSNNSKETLPLIGAHLRMISTEPGASRSPSTEATIPSGSSTQHLPASRFERSRDPTAHFPSTSHERSSLV